MSAINHQGLRELATDLQRMATHQKLLAFRAMLSPSAVLAMLDELEHARTTAPAIRLTLHHEIADFCATLEAPGEPETPEAIQQELLQRIDKVFDFFSEPLRNQNMHTQKNRLPCRNQSGYISAAPHKTGAGILNPIQSKAHNRASGFFVRTVLPRLFRVRIMAGRTGPTSVGPDSLLSGVENPVRLATPRFSTLDGELFLSPSKEATPWQTANSTAHTLRVVTSRLKSTADFPAHSASLKSCTSICCMSVAANFQTSIHPLFSAIWRMICASFSSSSSSKTNPINSCSGPFLHLAAGGLRTSVVKRIAA